MSEPEPEYEEGLLLLAVKAIDRIPGVYRTAALTDEEKVGFYIALLMMSKPARSGVSLANIKRHVIKALSISFPPN